ncbi:MAG TPA: non-heme iron oxygenase ferredoxin subunit [Acidimicrobiia bacterium]|nr:non-heme iron oxygenase ferredoxin subunit [Acidimicrobiia bacterium]
MKVELGALDTLPRDRGVRVTLGETRIAVFRVADEVFAIADRCSHAEASLAEGEVYGTDVECPRHGSEFDLRTGEPSSLPATRPVPVYEVRIEDGNVYLLLEDL